ncbi:MAG: hypothetical protein SVU94_01345 [Bacteroidota bacterium]|nr:hypothetical protein [Bacteroidota bacterium]
MIQNKKVILPFLLLAWTIIFAHNIIPHHHHHSHHNFSCNHCHAEHHQNTFTEELNDQIYDCNDHACHFHIEVLRQVSIDHVFIAASDNIFSDFLPILKSERITFYLETRYETLFYTNQLRAPPIFV